MNLLPNKLQEKWAEEATNNVTDIECVLKFIREQTEAAERFNRLKPADKKVLGLIINTNHMRSIDWLLKPRGLQKPTCDGGRQHMMIRTEGTRNRTEDRQE
jgi:hypothetical protein